MSNPTHWEVIVGNVGTTYNGVLEEEARASFSEYVKLSKESTGRASGEDVTLRHDDRTVEEYCAPRRVSILSIDAWRDREGWTWNAWYKRGEIAVDDIPKTNRGILAFMRKEGFLSDYSKGRVSVEDDQFNIVICDRHTLEPLFAIAYGEAY